MNNWREFMKRLLALVLVLNVLGLSLSCLAICADHTEQLPYTLEENNVSFIEENDQCCSLNPHKSLPPERIQKTPATHIIRPLLPVEIFGLFHSHLTLSLVDFASPPAQALPLKRISPLRI
jgi:hypothetical protein